MCEAMYAISGKKRGYVEEVEASTLRRGNRFAIRAIEIPMMHFFGKRLSVFLHVQIRSLSQMLTKFSVLIICKC
jgi:hypothetical protein